MKKFLSLALAVLMIAALSATAFAEFLTSPVKVTEAGGGATIEVIGKYNHVAEADVISVDIEWGAMEFTYTPATKGEWDPATHTYKNPTAEKWEANGNTFTITNHSNVGITASLSTTPPSGYTETYYGYSVTCTDNWTDDILLPAATGKSLQDAALSKTVAVKVQNEEESIPPVFVNNTPIMTIGITISKTTNNTGT